jgi:Holliday junction resolvase
VNTRKPPLESRVKKKILERLRQRGGFWYKTHGSPVVTRGLPDIIGCYRGRYIAFEVKRDASGKPTALQQFRMEEIKRAGGIARLIYSADQAVALLDRLDELKEARARQHNSGDSS